MNTKETYFALSTPPGISAIANVRISGPKALDSICLISKKNKSNFQKNTTMVLNIYNKNNSLLDKCVVCFFKKPNSYTGEDIVEIHTHGNPVIVSGLFELLIDQGLRLAEPGEFTRDAYLNNKLDLIQAESVAAIIQSKTLSALNISMVGAGGNLSKKFKQIKISLVRVLGNVEYELDISETDNTKKTTKQATKSLKKIEKTNKKLIKGYRGFLAKNRGARVSIVGPPNVGKSTLFNCLLKKNRSIVSNTPGTTRDVVDSDINIGGTPIVLVDTAGVRYSKDPIENQGVIKTKQEITKADLVLSVLDVGADPRLDTNHKKPAVCVINKIDTLTKKELSSLKTKHTSVHFISAKKGFGIKNLREAISQKILKVTNKDGGHFITSERQKNTLVRVNSLINPYTKKNKPYELELAAQDIKDAIKEFDVLLGRTSPDDVLNEVFSSFCVGK